ncbi:hypothetical protein WR25_15193 [Diploscapter pachys]|uniref:Amidase domain-containing protein n=1 Tax=Diploscapter pachys TaxID=2018661 RepID=A0A2A2K0A2_9BILA|nr:hypothetical protein WR25_15193 [Diploscapter pachys]
MGNALVSELETWTVKQWLWTAGFGTFVIFVVSKFIFAKPWGIIRNYKRAIEQNNERRRKGFAEFEERIRTEDAQVNDKRKKILGLSLLQLREALQKDHFTAMEVLEAYVEKAMQIQKEINCCTQVISEAFDYAREADEKWSGKSDKPPLYGLPFSVKENFHLKGYDCTVGVAKFLNQPKSHDCSLVVHLKQLGAVPFVVTNVPQGLISFVCSNTVYGTTSNPHDHSRTPGGSSGGEAALYASGGSAFGIGSDLAGSLRIPASLCGVVSFKPTQDRFIVKRSHDGIPGRGRLGLSFGFFTSSVDEQMFLLECCIGTDAYRQIVPQTPPAPLRLEMIDASKKMKFGYFETDGFADPVPAMRRSVIETVEKLKSEGHELVKFEVPDVRNMIDIMYKNILPDQGAYMKFIYGNDLVDENLKIFVFLLNVPRSIRKLTSYLVAGISPQLSAICAASVRDLSDLRYTQELTDNYRQKFIDYWKSLGIDALICPAFIGYNMLLKDQREAAKNSEGLPCSVQIVTLPYEEELCLHAMKQVEAVWRKN